MMRELRIANISGGDKGWAVINSRGPFGDDIVAGYLTERDAAVCLEALGLRDELEAMREYG